MKVKVFDNQKTQSTVEVPKEIFGAPLNKKLVFQAVNTQLNNLRSAIAHTKNRGEVSGGGRKPFKQKGTGNARAGSTRSPLWIGGGITFGPRNNRNFSQNLPRKMRRRAIFMSLSQKLKENKLIVVKSLKMDQVKTAKVQSFLEELPIENGKILAILGYTEPNFELSVANLPYIKAIQVQNINVLDLVKYDYLLVDVESLKALSNVFLKEEKPVAKESK